MFASFSSSEKIIEKSHRLLEKGRVEKAVQVFETPLRRDPENVQLRLGLAEVYCRIREGSSALREFRKAFKADPERGEEILEVLKAPPGGVSSADFFELQTEILIRKRDFPQALQIIAATDSKILTRTLERTGTRLEELRRFSGKGENLQQIVDLSYRMALILEHRKAYGKAFALYDSIIKIREEELLLTLPRLEELVRHVTGESAPFLCLGNLLQVSDPRKAANYYDRALDIDPQSASQVLDAFPGDSGESWEAWLLGKAALLKGDPAKGIAWWRRLSGTGYRKEMIRVLHGIDPGLPGAGEALLFLGDCLLEEKKFSDAAGVWGRLHGKIDPPLLRERFDQLVQQDPRNMEAVQILGDLCLEDGDRTSFIRQMRKVVQADPGQAEVLFEKVFPLLGEHPEDPELVLFLGELSLQHPERERSLILLRYFIRLAGAAADRALPLLDGLREKDPALFEVPLALAEGWMALGRKEEAFEALQEAIRLEPQRGMETLHLLSSLVRTVPSLGEPVDRLLGDLEEAGMVNPAVQWVRGEARIASGRFREGMDRIILAALQVPSQLPVVEEALREWENAHPDQEAIPLGMAELAFRRKRYEEVAEVLDRWLHRRPGGAGTVIAFYRAKLQQFPKILPLREGLVSAFGIAGMYDLVLEEGKKSEVLFPASQLSQIHRMMGDACLETGRLTESVTFLFQAVREDPATAEAVIDGLQRILSMHHALPRAALALGMVLSNCRRVGEGVAVLLRLARDLPKSRETVVRYLGKIASRYPAAAEPILAIAELTVEAGRDDQALDLLWKAMQREGDHADTVLRLLDRIARKNPRMARVHLEMGKVYRKIGLHRKAVDHIRRAVKQDPSFAEEGMKCCHDMIARTPDDLAPYETVSSILVGMKRPVAAVTFLSSSIEARPALGRALLALMEMIAGKVDTDPEILKVLAANYLRAGRIDEAVSGMADAVRRDPSSAREGVRFFDALLKEAPDHRSGRRARGNCRLFTLDLLGAFEDLRGVVLQDPERAEADIASLETLREKGFQNTELILLLTELYGRTNRIDRAVDLLREALQGSPPAKERTLLLIRLAEQYERQGKEAEVLRTLQEAGTLSRDRRFYYRKVNQFALERIRFEVRALQQARDRGEALSPEDLIRLITHLVFLGREEEAERVVQEEAGQRPSDEGRKIRRCFLEETGQYALAAELGCEEDPERQAWLQLQAGNLLQGASLLEQSVRQVPSSVLQSYLKDVYAVLMEETLLQERHPLVGETRLRPGGLRSVRERGPVIRYRA